MEENEVSSIKELIYEIRGLKVMFDSDLANLYGVEIKRLNENVKRNYKRFPPDFMFQLTEEEWKNQRSQIATFNKDIRKYRKIIVALNNLIEKPKETRKIGFYTES